MKKLNLIILTLLMIFFKNIASANYDKVIYDFKREHFRRNYRS